MTRYPGEVSKGQPAPTPSRLVRAAGAVVWRIAPGAARPRMGQPIDVQDLQVLVVHRPRYNDWSWPKGKAEHGEEIALTAVREVEEETGFAIRLGVPITSQRYRLGSGQTKEVRYWVGTVLPRGAALDTRPPVQPASRKEIDQTMWVSPMQAHSLLTRRGDRRLLDEVTHMAASGTLISTTVMLLRHANAVPKAEWSGDEASRPLTRFGIQQAQGVVGLLSAFGVDRLMSSPWQRCVSTVSAYAALGGVKVEPVQALTETAVASNPAVGAQVISDLVNEMPGSTAISVHRPTLTTLMRPLEQRAPARVQGGFPQLDPWLNTAEVLVAHVVRPEFLHGPDHLLPDESDSVSALAHVEHKTPIITAVERHHVRSVFTS